MVDYYYSHIINDSQSHIEIKLPHISTYISQCPSLIMVAKHDIHRFIVTSQDFYVKLIRICEKPLKLCCVLLNSSATRKFYRCLKTIELRSKLRKIAVITKESDRCKSYECRNVGIEKNFVEFVELRLR